MVRKRKQVDYVLGGQYEWKRQPDGKYEGPSALYVRFLIVRMTSTLSHCVFANMFGADPDLVGR